MKVERDQWIVRPHPLPRKETSGSRSKMVNGMEWFLRAWARVRPVMPAPMIRTCGRGRDGAISMLGRGLGGDGSEHQRHNSKLAVEVTSEMEERFQPHSQSFTVSTEEMVIVAQASWVIDYGTIWEWEMR
jgi:hypothetical protein